MFKPFLHCVVPYSIRRNGGSRKERAGRSNIGDTTGTYFCKPHESVFIVTANDGKHQAVGICQMHRAQQDFSLSVDKKFEVVETIAILKYAQMLESTNARRCIG